MERTASNSNIGFKRSNNATGRISFSSLLGCECNGYDAYKQASSQTMCSCKCFNFISVRKEFITLFAVFVCCSKQQEQQPTPPAASFNLCVLVLNALALASCLPFKAKRAKPNKLGLGHEQTNCSRQRRAKNEDK